MTIIAGDALLPHGKIEIAGTLATCFFMTTLCERALRENSGGKTSTIPSVSKRVSTQRPA
jgi:hypothetical protein